MQSLSYDAWGRRRNPDWTDSTTVQLTSTSTKRGYTGHEHLDDMALVHMNGRVYDPALGRMLAADPFVQSPADSQSFNRYSYVGNSPLSATDPSGYRTVGFAPFVPGLGGGLGGGGQGGVTRTPHTGVNIRWVMTYSWIQSLLASVSPPAGSAGYCTSFACTCDPAACTSSLVGEEYIPWLGPVGLIDSVVAYVVVTPVTYFTDSPPTYAPYQSASADGQGFFSRRWNRGGLILPNIRALGDRGAPGTIPDFFVGAAKAAYNMAADLGDAATPWTVKMIRNATLGSSHRFDIADEELMGAATAEGVLFVAGAVKSVAGAGQALISRFAARGTAGLAQCAGQICA